MVHIDSPGGTTAGSEQLHDALRKVAEAKPLVVVVDGLAASGGYMAAISGDHIVAQSTSLVGSIGVIFQFPNVSDLLKTVGVKVEEVKSSPLKAAPNGFEPTSPEARAALESIVRDSYAWFKDMVPTRRNLTGSALDQVSDGRVFTGRQAVDLKLVDELGDEQTAIAWLAKEKNIDAKTPVRDWKLNDSLGNFSFIHLGAVAIAQALGHEIAGPTHGRGCAPGNRGDQSGWPARALASVLGKLVVGFPLFSGQYRPPGWQRRAGSAR